MAIPSRQIGWGTEENLLWQISKQIEKLTCVTAGGCGSITTTTTTTTLPVYRVYTALLTQTGTNAPVATVLENTLGGDIIWSYSGTGSYYGTLAGAFTSQKTFFYVYGEATYNNGPNIYTQKIRNINIITDGLIGLDQTELIFTNGVFSSAGNTNSFSNIPIEIRVYN